MPKMQGDADYSNIRGTGVAEPHKNGSGSGSNSFVWLQTFLRLRRDPTPASARKMVRILAAPAPQP
jgi:hypothetical protein